MPKTHLRDTTAKQGDYLASPHISKAIRQGRFTSCRILTERITDLISEVDCKRCLAENARAAGNNLVNT